MKLSTSNNDSTGVFESFPPTPLPVVKLPPLKRRPSEELEQLEFGEDGNLQQQFSHVKRTKKHTFHVPPPIVNTSATYLQNDESDYHFLMSLKPFLSAIPYHRKLAVRTRLQQILMEENESLLTYEEQQQPQQQSQHPGSSNATRLNYNAVYSPDSECSSNSTFAELSPNNIDGAGNQQ